MYITILPYYFLQRKKYEQELRKNTYGEIFTFTLEDYDLDGNIIVVKYRGCYLIVYNGYALRPGLVDIPWQELNKF